MDLNSGFTILHLFGVALGAGGAYLSDLMFFSSIRDRILSKTEIRFLKLGGATVWTGLIFLILSGSGIFLLQPEYYLQSSKFMAKMTIVLVILLNGIFFHIEHLPRMQRHEAAHLPSSDEFIRRRVLLCMSGAISVTSWSAALALGALRQVPFSYGEIMMLYGIALAIAMMVSFFAARYILPSHSEEYQRRKQ